ncbi:MAG TPA: redox-sensing transcriptional repressor Rex [Longimicrobiales bacterium]|nr:redox-sensing transcriptional repressor Rex [Longimicrobiales bacterium]
MKKISEPTIGRLSVYLRLLMELAEKGVATVSSEELARQSGTTAAQVRKDLSLFGTFGKRGLGYAVPELVSRLRSILGLEKPWRVALVGAGRIGAALFGYENFRRQGFNIEAVFDTDPVKVGQRWNGLVVQSDESLESVLEEGGIEIAVVAVPARAAQGVVDRLVKAGIRGILNFAPTQLEVPSDVVVRTVDMALEMEGLSYALSRGERASGAA